MFFQRLAFVEFHVANDTFESFVSRCASVSSWNFKLESFVLDELKKINKTGNERNAIRTYVPFVRLG